MDTVTVSMLVVPGIVTLLLFLVFTYLYEQTRQEYFRAWQLGWAAYTLHYAVDSWDAFHPPAVWASLLSSLALVAMALCIFVSTRLMREKFRVRWTDVAVGIAGIALCVLSLRRSVAGPVLRPETGVAIILLYCSAYFYYIYGHRRNSLAFKALAVSLALWAVLMGFGQVNRYAELFDKLGPIPQMLLGIAMVMVLAENERTAVQENALAFSTLGVDPMRLLSAEDLAPSMQNILDRLIAPLPTSRAVICISERWRAVLPSAQEGFSPEFLKKLEKSGAGEYICELAYRRGGFVPLQNVPEMLEPLPTFPGGRFAVFRQVMEEANILDVTAVSLQTRERNFGVILFPHAARNAFGSSNLRLLIGLALQIGLTLENYVVMHDAQRRTKEFELLTQIGQAISSRLDQDEILRTLHQELGRIFDTTDFYIALLDNDDIRFELEVEGGETRPKRSRKVGNALTEYIIRTGQPLLIRSDLEKTKERLGVTFVPPRPAKCFCGVPILLGGKPAGVMAAMNVNREYVFEQRDLEMMQTAAGQVSVAVENARLFAEEQRRARQFAFLNNISKTAISSEDSEQMLAEIVGHIQRNFRFDHIGIGILDYFTKDIEIKAEAGATTQALGKRIPLGVGILGRVARTGERALVQSSTGDNLQGVLPGSRAVLCIPINYGESLLGVLNVESQQDDAFNPQDVLVMNTLADLLATALHNSIVFKQLQQQSITDGLTGIKTRRFFFEALNSELKRASRSGRPFSVVLMDLDKLKHVNDTKGHLEGDLVLARVGRLLEQKCRQSNVVARYGGDEFVILMPETGVEQAQALAERLRLWIDGDATLQEHHITGSFGVATFPVHGFTTEDIIHVADAGMYVSKRAGGDLVSTMEPFEEGETSGARRQAMSRYLEGFLQREHTGNEDREDLIGMLRKVAGSEEKFNVAVLREAIEILNRAAESREMNASGHGDLTSRYANCIARALGFSDEEMVDLSFAARVHDVGKIFIPERTLNKSGPLTESEFQVMKLHARWGANILATIPDSKKLQEAAEHHHEALDGSGYPDGLRGDRIPLWARILSIADAYVNMTTDRSFAGAKSSAQALSELERMSGTRYDGMLVRTLIRELKVEKASPAVGN